MTSARPADPLATILGTGLLDGEEALMASTVRQFLADR
jgi:hypothetical protein